MREIRSRSDRSAITATEDSWRRAYEYLPATETEQAARHLAALLDGDDRDGVKVAA